MLFLLSACTPAPTPAPVPTPGGILRDGTLATIAIEDERFRIWVTNPDLRQQLEAWARGQIEPDNLSGTLVGSSGSGAYNAPWHWHLAPDSIRINTETDPDCAVRPGQVEDDLTTFLEEIGR